MRKAFTIYAAAVLGLYGLVTLSGADLATGRRGFIPAGVRQSSGGYRSYAFWGGGK